MPVRMEKDQPDPRRNRNNDTGPNTTEREGRRVPLIWIFIAIFGIIKKPKLFVPLVIIVGLFFLFKDSFLGGLGGPVFEYEAGSDQFSFGAELDEKEYDKAMVFEPLAVGSSRLPSSVSLARFAPKILHQGSQGSCSGWASAYGARTISYAQANGRNPNQVAFSPSFLYNQIALPRCQGAYLGAAMEAMKKIGSLPFKEFGYTDRTCQIKPDRADVGAAANFRIKGYNRLTQGANNYSTDLHGIKQHLAQGAPVVVGMLVGQSFMQGMMGRKTWRPSRAEYSGQGLGGHAMCVVGYDDQMNGGAFQIMNSWGPQWGENGYAWIRYQDFEQFTKEAYGLFPEGKAKRFDSDRMEVKFALVENQSQRAIPLRQTDEIVFRTTSPLPKGAKFKLAITNSVECYTYIFGKETNGSSYVLFPYTQKHSPYCGITGTRLFPRDYSMTLDDVGSRDYIAIVVSKKPLDYQRVNAKMNASRAAGFTMRMVESLIEDFVPECKFEVGEHVYFNCNTAKKNVIGMVIEIDKR